MPEEATPNAAIRGLGAGAKDAAMELLDVLFDWVVPLLTLIVGYVLSSSIGLSGLIGTAVDGVLGSAGVSATVMNYVADIVAILIWGCIGAGMWYAAKKVDGYAAWILKPLATLFWGFAFGEVGALANGKVQNGTLGSSASKLASGA